MDSPHNALWIDFRKKIGSFFVPIWAKAKYYSTFLWFLKDFLNLNFQKLQGLGEVVGIMMGTVSAPLSMLSPKLVFWEKHGSVSPRLAFDPVIFQQAEQQKKTGEHLVLV